MEWSGDCSGKVRCAVGMEKVTVGIAQGRVVSAGECLISYALGSCVGVCLYDGVRRIAGMAHIILPGSRYAARKDNPYKFADEGIYALMEEMKCCGAVPGNITAKIAGGARMFGDNTDRWPVGEMNVEAVKQTLSLLGIPLIASDTGGTHGRTILFYSENGKLEINTVRQKPFEL